eukprot:6214815-Pleurochrysis_carterae.AAC.2
MDGGELLSIVCVKCNRLHASTERKLSFASAHRKSAGSFHVGDWLHALPAKNARWLAEYR